jgi:hypothetical protein
VTEPGNKLIGIVLNGEKDLTKAEVFKIFFEFLKTFWTVMKFRGLFVN